MHNSLETEFSISIDQCKKFSLFTEVNPTHTRLWLSTVAYWNFNLICKIRQPSETAKLTLDPFDDHCWNISRLFLRQCYLSIFGDVDNDNPYLEKVNKFRAVFLFCLTSFYLCPLPAINLKMTWSATYFQNFREGGILSEENDVKRFAATYESARGR